MSIKNPLEEIDLPFRITENGSGYHQTHGPLLPSGLLLRQNLEKLLEDALETEDFDPSNIQGILGEKIALRILEREFLRKNNIQENLEIKSIGGNSGYLINSSGRYFAKLESPNRIVILEKNRQRNKSHDQKFGFRKIAEIDGLFMFKQKMKPRNLKRFMVIESKTGEVNLSAQHVLRNIINPLERMYKCPIHYMVIGFKEKIYSDTKTNKLSPQMQRFYEGFPRELRNRFHLAHFPFSRLELDTRINALDDSFSKRIRGKAIYDIQSGHLILTTPLGEVHTLKVEQDKTL